jgi:hypothetical protein
MSLRLLAAAAIAAAVIAPARAAIVSYASDASFIASGFQGRFGGNVRWGNNASNGDWEFAVVNGSDTPYSGQTRQLNWTGIPNYGSSPNHRYEFVYNVVDGANNDSVTLRLRDTSGGLLGGSASQYSSLDFADINTLAVRARAAAGDVATLQNIRVEFQNGGFAAFETLGTLVGDADAEYLVLQDDRLAGGFRVVIAGQTYGTATFTDGSGSLPAYQFKVGITPVPLPAALPAFAAGLGLLALFGRSGRRRR